MGVTSVSVDEAQVMSKKARALIATAAVAGLVAAGLLIAFITNQTSGSTASPLLPAPADIVMTAVSAVLVLAVVWLLVFFLLSLVRRTKRDGAPLAPR